MPYADQKYKNNTLLQHLRDILLHSLGLWLHSLYSNQLPEMLFVATPWFSIIFAQLPKNKVPKKRWPKILHTFGLGSNGQQLTRLQQKLHPSLCLRRFPLATRMERASERDRERGAIAMFVRWFVQAGVKLYASRVAYAACGMQHK